MKKQLIIATLCLAGNIILPVCAQNAVTTTPRRTTSQGDPNARLEYTTPGVTPEMLAVPLAETVIARYPDYRTAYWKDYTYVQGYMFEAMDRLGQLTGDDKYLEYMKKYIDHFVDAAGNYTGGALTNLDNFMTGSAFCTLYHRTKDGKYKKAALQILEKVGEYPSSDGQFWHGNKSPNMWIDGVFMMQMFLVRCAQYVGETDYCLEVACRNIVAAANHLQRPDGLVLHAWTTEPEKAAWADKKSGLSPEVWSEGMGWYTLVVPELLAILPKNHPQYAEVLRIYQRMAKALKETQDANTGGWYMVVDKGDDPLNFIDPSGTGMFVYSIQRGIDLGLLKAKEYAEVARRGYECLRPFIRVNERGLLELTGACDGVVIKKDFESYVTVPKILNAKEAVAGVLWAAVIMEKEKLGQTTDRWKIENNGAIRWDITRRIPHSDHVEMSGQQLSVVLRYGVDATGAFHLNRSLVFPMLRINPNKTQHNLKQRFEVDIPAMVTIDDLTLFDEKVKEITFNGIMTVESSFSHIYRRQTIENAVSLTRVLYPSTQAAYHCEEYSFRNNTENAISMRIPEWKIKYTTPQEEGVYGAYRMEATLSKSGTFEVKPGETLEFYAIFGGQKLNDAPFAHIDIQKERANRQALIDQWWGNLILDTPDKTLNTMFAFAKIRGAESIYHTKGGLMHGPGGEAYYAAVWANDQAEYINPFFPFLGYEIGNQSALNSFRHFARYMNEEYRPIPSSIISEGVGFWHGAKDRGDGAMIAYGASRYALARGSREEARELWPLIEWCLEFCNRKLTKDGVVASDSDELENRFPAGNANLCTSTLYYDALLSASLLGKELGVASAQLTTYSKQAVALRKAIETHFGYEIEGYHSYRYYEGNDVLRSWISMPLTMGIYDRAPGTIDALFSPRLWTNDGLLTQAGTETFWDRSTLYALRGSIAAGEVEKGMDFLKKYSRRRLLGDHVPYAIEAWPEGNQRHLSAESGLYCRIFTEGLFGIRPTGLRSFEMTPRLPHDWEYAHLNSVRAFNADLDIKVSRAGKKLQVMVYNKGKCILKKQIAEGTTVKVMGL